MEIFTFSSACFHLEALKTCHKENSISEAKVLLGDNRNEQWENDPESWSVVPPFF